MMEHWWCIVYCFLRVLIRKVVLWYFWRSNFRNFMKILFVMLNDNMTMFDSGPILLLSFVSHRIFSKQLSTWNVQCRNKLWWSTETFDNVSKYTMIKGFRIWLISLLRNVTDEHLNLLDFIYFVFKFKRFHIDDISLIFRKKRIKQNEFCQAKEKKSEDVSVKRFFLVNHERIVFHEQNGHRKNHRNHQTIENLDQLLIDHEQNVFY